MKEGFTRVVVAWYIQILSLKKFTMKKQRLSFKRMLGIFVAIGCSAGVHAQLTETMGTAGPATETVTAREANNRFDMTALTYSGTADVRTTVPSTGADQNIAVA